MKGFRQRVVSTIQPTSECPVCPGRVIDVNVLEKPLTVVARTAVTGQRLQQVVEEARLEQYFECWTERYPQCPINQSQPRNPYVFYNLIERNEECEARQCIPSRCRFASRTSE